MKREQLAWTLVGLLNLLAVLILWIGLAPLDGHAILFNWQLILALALATLGFIILLLWLMVRK